jgi:hypothetical protein
VRPLEALQETLDAEHAAVYVYALLGGRISASADPGAAAQLQAAYDVHRARRDQLRSRVADLGETPDPAEPAYQVDAHTRDPDALRRVALSTEERCAVVYAQLVGSSTGSDRRWGLTALTDAALRMLSFGGSPTAYPGLPEL